MRDANATEYSIMTTSLYTLGREKQPQSGVRDSVEHRTAYTSNIYTPQAGQH